MIWPFNRKPPREPQRLLDDIAAALQFANNSRRHPRLIRSVRLCDQFDQQIDELSWQRLRKALSCPLPPLVLTTSGGLNFPTGWTEVGHLLEFVTRRVELNGSAANESVTRETWIEAQIFVGVREVLVNALGVDTEEVTRSSQLIRDLGAY